MKKMRGIRNLLNELKWKKQGKNVVIEIVYRGEKEDKKLIPFESITEIGKGYFRYGKKETYVPYHRVRKIIKVERLFGANRTIRIWFNLQNFKRIFL
jgi:uncharacterized protein (UPF0248 family)